MMFQYPYHPFSFFPRRNRSYTNPMYSYSPAPPLSYRPKPIQEKPQVCSSPHTKSKQYGQQPSSNKESTHQQNNSCLANPTKKQSNDECLFEIFGIRLYFDDILIVGLMFFLYTEGVKDQSLFIALTLLLLS